MSDEPLPKMPELKRQDADISMVSNRRMRRAWAKEQKIFKKGRDWKTYNAIVKGRGGHEEEPEKVEPTDGQT